MHAFRRPLAWPRPLAARLLLLALIAANGPSAAAEAPTRNGFPLEPSSVPAEEIRRGGPPRDGIPALDEPATIPADEAPWDDDEMVVALTVDGEARAYPLRILEWHELVNDRVAGRPILVSYCPLCASALVFDRRLEGETLRFGVSGLLYRSDLLMFDRGSESLWSQIGARAVTGPRRGERLELIRSRIERWGAWRREHPDTRVLSPDTGHERDYGRSPYAGYDSSSRLLHPMETDDRYHPKMPTVGLRGPGGEPARAYPASELRRAGGRVEERFHGKPVEVTYDLDARVFSVKAPDDVEVIEAYWFAWVAFHPETSVFTAPGPEAAEQDAAVP